MQRLLQTRIVDLELQKLAVSHGVFGKQPAAHRHRLASQRDKICPLDAPALSFEAVDSTVMDAVFHSIAPLTSLDHDAVELDGTVLAICEDPEKSVTKKSNRANAAIGCSGSGT